MAPIRESQESKEESEEVGEERPSLQHSELEVLHSCIHVFPLYARQGKAGKPFACCNKFRRGNLYRSLPAGFCQQDRDRMQKLQAVVGPEYRTDLYSELFKSNCCL